MIALYLIALVPLIIGGFLFYYSKKVHWIEWLGCSLVAFILSGLFNLFAVIGMTKDTEVWSGQVTSTEYHPQWIEQYRQRHTQTYTTGSGKNARTHTRTWYTTEHATHSEHWEAQLSFGNGHNEEIDVPEARYLNIKGRFGGKIVTGGKQSTSHGGHFDGGDNNIYATMNGTGYVYPVVTTKSFENRIKAAPSVFSYVKVPASIPVYEYPLPVDTFSSQRLLGTAQVNIDATLFDQMNAFVGPSKYANIIMIGFTSMDEMISKYQEAKWYGAKKNDIVICYNCPTNGSKAVWCYTFGFTEKILVKRNLETILLENPVNDSILPLIQKEVMTNYEIKDWGKFDYITIEPPMWVYAVLLIVMLLTQGGLWLYVHFNGLDSDTSLSSTSSGKYRSHDILSKHNNRNMYK